MILGPGIAIKKRLEFGPSLTEEQIAGLRNGKLAIYVHGEILYVDAFKQKRCTRYRLMHHITGGVIGVSTDLTFAEGGNEAN
jgi:hypothetical protein